MSIQGFCKRSWWRSALALLLIMAMITTMMMVTVEEANASTLAIAGCVVSGVALLAVMSTLQGAGFDLSESNVVPVVNSYWGSIDQPLRASYGVFESGMIIGSTILESINSWISDFTRTINGLYTYYFTPSNPSLIPRIQKVRLNNMTYYAEFVEPLVVTVDDVSGSTLGLSWEFTNIGYLASGQAYGDFVLYLDDGTSVTLASVPADDNYITNVEFGSDIQLNPYSHMLYLRVRAFALNGSAVSSHALRYDANYSAYSDEWSLGPAAYQCFYYDLMGNFPDLPAPSSVVTGNLLSEWLPTSTDSSKALTAETPIFLPQTLDQVYESLPSDMREGTFAGGGVVNPDIPTTGETSGTITGEGAGTGVFEGVGSWLMDFPILGDILGVLRGVLDGITGLVATVGTIATSVATLASGEVPPELEAHIRQFSGQIFDLLSFDELTQTLSALEDFGSGYGDPPEISINLHTLLEPAKNVGAFNNQFANMDTTVIDFEILEDDRFSFMGFTLIELIRIMAGISMIWYTVWYVWEKIVPDDAVR